MNGHPCHPAVESLAHAHVRELLRSWGSFLTAVELECAVSSRTRISAGAAAAALQKVADDVLRMTRDFRELRRSEEELQQELRRLERQVEVLCRVLEERQVVGV
jgi:septation ring formation regulator EzrA